MMFRVTGLKEAELEQCYKEHYNSRKHHSEEHNKKISEALTGRHLSDGHRKKISDFAKTRTGKKSPMFGKHHTDETKKIISEALTGKHLTEETKKKISEKAKTRTGEKSSMFGKHLTEEHKKKISEKMKTKTGSKNPMFGKHHTEETKRKKSEANKKYWENPKCRKEKSECTQRLWQNPEYAKKVMQARGVKPNKPELIVGYLSDRITNESYLYTGDGDLIIGGKCPDFVNVNGQKKPIEVFGDYWHGECRTGRTKEQEEMKRKEHFARYGWETLIIWENELNDLAKLEKKILKFNEITIDALQKCPKGH